MQGPGVVADSEAAVAADERRGRLVRVLAVGPVAQRQRGDGRRRVRGLQGRHDQYGVLSGPEHQQGEPLGLHGPVAGQPHQIGPGGDQDAVEPRIRGGLGRAPHTGLVVTGGEGRGRAGHPCLRMSGVSPGATGSILPLCRSAREPVAAMSGRDRAPALLGLARPGREEGRFGAAKPPCGCQCGTGAASAVGRPNSAAAPDPLGRVNDGATPSAVRAVGSGAAPASSGRGPDIGTAGVPVGGRNAGWASASVSAFAGG